MAIDLPAWFTSDGRSLSNCGGSVSVAEPMRSDEAVALAFDRCLEHVHRGAADEARNEQVGRRLVEALRRVELLQTAPRA